MPTPVPLSHPLQRIRKISRLMLLACWVMMLLLPVLLVFYWATTSAPGLARQGNLLPGAIQAPLEIWQRVVAGAVTAIPLALLLLGIWQAKCCFEQFANGDVFTAQATRQLRSFSGWVAAAAFAAILASAITSVVLTLNNPPGLRHLSVGIGSDHVFTLFFAGLVWLMAAVIGQGQMLAEENERFV